MLGWAAHAAESDSAASPLTQYCPVVLAFMPPEKEKHGSKHPGTKALKDSFPSTASYRPQSIFQAFSVGFSTI